MNKGGLGITLILLPVLIMAMFGFNVYREGQSFDTPRSYVHMLSIGETGDQVCSTVAVAPNQVLTAFHCTGDGSSKEILKVAGKIAKVIRYDQQNDLALLEVEGLSSPVAPLAASSPDKDDETVAVGYPLGKVQAVTEGRVMGLVEGYGDTYKLWSTVSILFGNSGGGLFEYRLGQWQLVGITVQVPGANLGFIGVPIFNVSLSVPIEAVRHFLYRT